MSKESRWRWAWRVLTFWNMFKQQKNEEKIEHPYEDLPTSDE